MAKEERAPLPLPGTGHSACSLRTEAYQQGLHSSELFLGVALPNLFVDDQGTQQPVSPQSQETCKAPWEDRVPPEPAGLTW